MTVPTWLRPLLDFLLRRRPPAPPPPVPPGTFRDLLALVNAERARAGVRALSADARLDRAAQGHSDRMATAGALSHQLAGELPFGRRIAVEGYVISAAAENIAWGQQGAPEVVAAWMGDAPHREGMLSPDYTQAGFGQSALYWTADFARPR